MSEKVKSNIFEIGDRENKYRYQIKTTTLFDTVINI